MNNCNECGSENSAKEVAQLKNAVANLTDIVNNIKTQTNFVLNGHPIMLIEHQDDIDAFNFSTALGSGVWNGWAVLNGQTIYNPVTKKSVLLPNWIDRFVVAAGGEYDNRSTGGQKLVSLTSSQNGAHTHSVTDPGHTHSVSDPGHNHTGASESITPSLTLDPHTHVATQESHSHQSASTDGAPDGIVGIMDTSNAGGPIGTHTTGAATPAITVESSSVSGSIGPFTPVVNVNSNTTGIGVNSKKTDITIATSGNGEGHENRPPYIAAFYVQKIW